MGIYLISFQMTEAEERYQSMVAAVKGFNLWARITRTTWCIKAENKTTAEVRATLKDRCPLQASERLFIVNITNSPWASSNIPKEVTDWLKDEN